MLVVSSRRGRIEAPAKISAPVLPGNLFRPVHFGENPTNVLTNSGALDPLAKIPEFLVNKAGWKNWRYKGKGPAKSSDLPAQWALRGSFQLIW